MRREQLESALRESPFRPFRVILTNGHVHEIRHPEFFMLMSGSAIVGHPDPAGAGADRYTVIDLSHVAEIERRGTPAAPGGGPADAA
jgi:hypothetical protein